MLEIGPWMSHEAVKNASIPSVGVIAASTRIQEHEFAPLGP